MLVVQKQPRQHQSSVSYKPSLFNIWAADADGNLVVVNTYSGAHIAVGRCDREAIERFLAAEVVAADDPAVGTLAACGILVPSAVDEVKQLLFREHTETWSQSDLHLIIFPTEKCNFRCLYCYETFEKGPMPVHVRHALKLFLEQRIPHLSTLAIDWFGGEPLIAFHVIDEVMEHVVPLTARHRCALSGHLTTNAYLLTPEKAARLLGWGVRSYQITVDGPREEHNKRRRLYKSSPASLCGADLPKGQPVQNTHGCAPDTGGTFDRIIGNVRALLDRRDVFSLCLRTNYDLDSLPAMAEWIDELSALVGDDPRVRVDFCPIWADPDRVPVSVPMGRERQQTMSELLGLAHARGLRTGVDEGLRFGGMVCYAAKPNSFAIRSDGTLNKCTVALEADYNQVGRLLPDGSLELVLHKLAKWTTSGVDTDPVCQNCPVSPACQGNVCPLERFENGQRPCPPAKTFPELIVPLVQQPAYACRT